MLAPASTGGGCEGQASWSANRLNKEGKPSGGREFFFSEFFLWIAFEGQGAKGKLGIARIG
jgi:hypothetical protein